MAGEKWYQDGLHFTCTQCGNCCSGSPGHVWVNADERRRVADFLGLDLEAFNRQYTYRVGLRYSLHEQRREDQYDCIFLKSRNGKRMCSIYPVQPVQCRTWPFWNENLKTPDTWLRASQGCPGMNAGDHHEFVHIEIRRQNKFG